MIDVKNYIFVHVPKTGGQSIKHALGGKTKEWPTHIPLSAIQKYNRYAFGFVRNPWDRMVSLYHFLCQKAMKHDDNFNQLEVRAAGFKYWLMKHNFFMKEDYRWSKGNLSPMQRRTQLFWLEGCDFIGCFENLGFDLQFACKRIGIKSPNKLSVANTTKHKYYREYYDNETIGHVAEHFAPEIEMMGYSF